MQLRLPRSELTVDELTFHIQELFASDFTLKSVVVSGEISELKRHSSGHCYFTLLGEESRVACALFKQHAYAVPKWPDNGDKVLVEGGVGLYPQRGVYQFYARRLIPVGEGAIERARLETRERLAREGLFAPELKRALPPFPSKIALITSGTGAAAWDVIRVAERRYPACALVLIPTTVHGAEAPLEIVRALARVAGIPKLDGVLLVRGEGAREDLVPFDDERVVRAVRSCPVPVVSGVGHDVDLTLCDLAADLRASTPSAAAELVFPDRRTLVQDLQKTQTRLFQEMRRQIGLHRTFLDRSESALLRVRHSLAFSRASLEERFRRVVSAMDLRIAAAREGLETRAAALDALSPLAVLGRGFAVCERRGERIGKARSLGAGDGVRLRFADGLVEAEVRTIIIEEHRD